MFYFSPTFFWAVMASTMAPSSAIVYLASPAFPMTLIKDVDQCSPPIGTTVGVRGADPKVLDQTQTPEDTVIQLVFPLKNGITMFRSQYAGSANCAILLHRVALGKI